MTQTTTHAPELTATANAAETGANATKVFQDKKKTSSPASSEERVSLLAGEVLSALADIIKRNDVSYAEYDAMKTWLIGVGEDGEWPLFLDVFVEHDVEAAVNAHRDGSKGSIEGPFYIPDAPEIAVDGHISTRPDEAGDPLRFHGQVRAVSGTPLAGAKLELWHADSDGYYSQFAPAIPEWNLRCTTYADADGHFAINTIQPAPYQIPVDGSTGKLIAAAGWHAWRPAHLHLKVSHPEHQLITTQLYFEGGDYLDADIASAVKPELVIAPQATSDGTGREVGYDFVLDPA